MNALIITKLTSANIPVTGSYETLPKMIANCIEDVKIFGWDYFKSNTSFGPKVIQIVKELSNQ